MAATLTQVATLRKDLALRDRVTAAIAKMATYIMQAEPPGTPNRKNRLKWALDALLSPETFSDRMMWAICGNATIQDAYVENSDQTDIADADIEYVVGVMVDVFA